MASDFVVQYAYCRLFQGIVFKFSNTVVPIKRIGDASNRMNHLSAAHPFYPQLWHFLFFYLAYVER